MTSANVSNMTVQTATSRTSADYGSRQKIKDDFLQVMSSLQEDASEISSMSELTKKGTADTSMKVNAKPAEMKEADPKKAEAEVVKKVKEETETFSKEVKDVISEELDVTDEEIAEAMENLGLTFLDLTEVSNLTKLVSFLSNCENNVSLLVDESFTNIVSQMNELTQGLEEKLYMPVEEFKNIVDMAAEGSETLVQSDLQNEVAVTEAKEEILSVEQMKVNESVVQKENQAVDLSGAVEEKIISQTETVEDEVEKIITEDVEAEDNLSNVEQVDVETVSQQQSESEDMSESRDFMRQGDQRQKTTFPVTENLTAEASLQAVNRYEPMTGEITLQTGERVHVREIIEQIVEQAKTTITTDNTTLEMLLNPEGLGKIYMEVSQKEGKVTAHIYTQDENVKQALENQMVQLKEQLNQNETKVNSIEVSVGTHEFEKNLEEGQQENPQNEMQKQEQKKTRNLNLNSLDGLSGLMTEEEELVAKMMRENGNSIDFTA